MNFVLLNLGWVKKHLIIKRSVDSSIYNPFRPEFLKKKIKILLYNFRIGPLAKSLPRIIFDAG